VQQQRKVVGQIVRTDPDLLRCLTAARAQYGLRAIRLTNVIDP
jgi:hypothetical protein